MMKFYTGCDIIEVSRIDKSINDSFLKEKVFTENEIKYCDSKNAMASEHYAARFAGKEATFKAISDLLLNNYSIGFKDIEILNEENGRPYVTIIKRDVKFKDPHMNLGKITFDITLSHLKEYAIANVVMAVDED